MFGRAAITFGMTLILVGYWLSMFTVFTVRQHAVKNKKCQLVWFMTGVRLTCNNLYVLLMNGYWKYFGHKTVKNQTCQFMPHLTRCRKIHWVNVWLPVYNKNQYWFMSCSCTPVLGLHQTSDWNSQHCKLLTFWSLHGSHQLSVLVWPSAIPALTA